MTKSNQEGFGAVEGLLLVIIVGLIVGLGWYIWQKKTPAPITNNQAAVSTTTKQAPKFTCDSETDWKTITNKAVSLPKWSVEITLPDSSVGKAVCKYDSLNNHYQFSTKAVVEDAKCVAYYGGPELTNPSLDVAQYDLTTDTQGQMGIQAGTLDEYYMAHKSKDGNYFLTPDSGRRYYKVGSHFYIAFGDATGQLEKYKAARTENCKNEKPDFMQQFVDSMSTLKSM